MLILPSRFYTRRGIRISAHFVFWALYLLVNVLMVKRLYPQEQISTLLLRFSFTLPIDIGATYLTVYVLFTRFLLKRRYLAFALSFIVSIVFFIRMLLLPE